MKVCDKTFKKNEYKLWSQTQAVNLLIDLILSTWVLRDSYLIIIHLTYRNIFKILIKWRKVALMLSSSYLTMLI